MATIWVDDCCAKCGKLVVGKGVLVAAVGVTAKESYQCFRPKQRVLRPLFRAGSKRVLYHPKCLPEGVLP